jgi:hypothetical protein
VQPVKVDGLLPGDLGIVFREVGIDGLQGDAAMAAQRLPCLDLAFFHEGLHGGHGQAQQLGRIAGAAVILAREIRRGDGGLEGLGFTHGHSRKRLFFSLFSF